MAKPSVAAQFLFMRPSVCYFARKGTSKTLYQQLSEDMQDVNDPKTKNDLIRQKIAQVKKAEDMKRLRE